MLSLFAIIILIPGSGSSIGGRECETLMREEQIKALFAGRLREKKEKLQVIKREKMVWTQEVRLARMAELAQLIQQERMTQKAELARRNQERMVRKEMSQQKTPQREMVRATPERKEKIYDSHKMHKRKGEKETGNSNLIRPVTHALRLRKLCVPSEKYRMPSPNGPESTAYRELKIRSEFKIGRTSSIPKPNSEWSMGRTFSLPKPRANEKNHVKP